MNRLGLVLALMLVAASAGAQVITDLGQKNMKIPPAEKKEEPSLRSTTEFSVNVDTTSVYYAMIDSAQACIEREQWSQAEEFFRRALTADPNNASNTLLLSNLATLQRFQNRHEDALRNYNLALDITPNAVTLLLNRAALLLEMGRTSDAVADFEHVAKVDPRDMESRYSLGVIAIEQGQLEQAQTIFDDMERINSKSPLLSEGRGLLCKARGEYEQAVEYIDMALKAGEDPRLLANKADCLLMTNQLFRASEAIQQAFALTPDDPYLYVLRAKLNKMRYNTEDMTRDINLAVEHGLDRELVDELLK